MRLTWLLVTSMACANQPDPDPDPVPEPARVTVLRGDSSVVGARVVFQEADSTLVAEVTTDDAGQAEATIADDGFVTVVAQEPESNFRSMHTFGNVRSGEQLTLTFPVTEPAIAFQVIVPEDPSPGVVAYQVTTRCGSGISQAAGAVEVTALCRGTTDVIVVAVGSGKWLYRDGITTDAGVTVDLSNESYSPPTSKIYELTGARPGTLDIFLERRTPGGSTIGNSVQDVGTGGTAVIDLTFPGAPASEQLSLSSVFGEQIDVWAPELDTIDLEPLLLPRLLGRITDAETGRAQWSKLGVGQQPQFLLAEETFFDEATMIQTYWATVTRYVDDAYNPPLLPADLAPKPENRFLVLRAGASSIDFAELRDQALGVLATSSLTRVLPASTSDGSLVTTFVQ